MTNVLKLWVGITIGCILVGEFYLALGCVIGMVFIWTTVGFEDDPDDVIRKVFKDWQA